MKIVTKVIANKLKATLPDVIDVEQSVFVQGRLITDNALIAMECFHWLKKKKKGKKG
jgi:cytochrome c-type biogenesis protein CcmE